MKSNFLTALRFIAALLTVAAIIGKPYLPPERLIIYPDSNIASYLYGAVDAEGQDEFGWLDQEENRWWCHHRPEAGSCGVTMTWGQTPASSDNTGPVCQSADSDEDGDGWGWENETSCKVTAATHAKTERPPETSDSSSAKTASAILDGTVDFSPYEGMNVQIHYEGKAQYIELYLRQQIPPSANISGADAGKFMSVFLRTEDLKAGPAYISLSEFSVAEWWVMTHNVPRKMARPEFDKIFTLGVAHTEHGMHKMRIDSVELIGDRISNKNFLFGILFFWCVFLLSEAALRYYWLYRASRQREALISNLTSTAESLEEEKQQLKTLATTDALTGVLNREGLRQYLLAEFGSEYLPTSFGVLMIDIDHFKHINDTYGHGIGDVILKQMAQLITKNIREGDLFARWGGEEFVLIARKHSEDSLLNLAEKLRGLIAKEPLEPTMNLHIEVSIGAAKVHPGDKFSTTLKRADIALYKAKQLRNCVVLE